MEWIESEDATRVRSLTLDEIGELFESERLPVTTEELIEKFGDHEVQYPRGAETIENILRTSGMETYETADEIQLAILNGVSRDAVGRPRYSDRGDEVDQDFSRMPQSF